MNFDGRLDLSLPHRRLCRCHGMATATGPSQLVRGCIHFWVDFGGRVTNCAPSLFNSSTLISMKISQVPSSNQTDPAVPSTIVSNGQATGSSLYLPHPLLSPPSGAGGQSFNLGYLIALLRRRFLLFSGVTLITFGGLFYRTVSQPPVYSGSLDMLIEPVVKSDGENVILNLARGSDASQLNYESQIRILRSPEVLNPILKQVQKQYPDLTYRGLHQGLSIKRDGDADVLQITYMGSDPKQVALVLEQAIPSIIAYVDAGA